METQEAPQAPQPNEPTEVDSTESKTVENAGTEDQTQQQETKQEPEKVSRATKIYLKQQEQLRKERDAFEQERQQRQSELEQQREEAKQILQWKQEIESGNPWSFLNANKLDLEKLYDLALQREQDPNLVVKKALEEREKVWQSQIDELKKEREQERFQQQKAQVEAQMQKDLGTVRDGFQQRIDADPERYELVSQFPEGAETAVQLVIAHCERTGERLDYEDALDRVENWLDNELQVSRPFFKTSKAKKYLLDSDSKDVIKNERKRSADPKDRSKLDNRASRSESEPRTLQAKKMTGVTTGASRDETPEERRERLFNAFAKGEYKPT